MTGTEFIQRISGVSTLTVEEVARRIEALEEAMLQCLEAGESILMPTLGQLSVVKTAETVVENPVTRQRVLLPPRLELVFESDATQDKEQVKASMEKLALKLQTSLSCEADDAFRFVHLLFTSLGEILFLERYVKVNGFGTFKLIEDSTAMKSRYLVSFHAEVEWQEQINKPFEHFEAIVLNDGVDFVEEPEETPVETSVHETEHTEQPGGTVEQATDIPENTPTVVRKGFSTVALLSSLLLGVALGAGITWFGLKPASSQKATVVQQKTATVTADVTKQTTKDTIRVVKTAQDSIIAEEMKTQVLPSNRIYRMSDTLTTHTLLRGESLAKLSQKYYGNRDLWIYIVRYNSFIKDPDNVPVGTILQIPRLSPQE